MRGKYLIGIASLLLAISSPAAAETEDVSDVYVEICREAFAWERIGQIPESRDTRLDGEAYIGRLIMALEKRGMNWKEDLDVAIALCNIYTQGSRDAVKWLGDSGVGEAQR